MERDTGRDREEDAELSARILLAAMASSYETETGNGEDGVADRSLDDDGEATDNCDNIHNTSRLVIRGDKDEDNENDNEEGARGDDMQKLVPLSYKNRGFQALGSIEKQIKILMTERKWPKIGWSDLNIEILLQQLAAQDSNNFAKKSSVGEREGRIYSTLVAKRNFNMGHGIGRSGDLTESQPKAIGSSILASLTNALALDVCRTLVSKDVEHAFVAPVATGMSISLVLLTLKKQNPNAKFVIWLRVDQKSCYKCIKNCGLGAVVVAGLIKDDEIQTDIEDVRNLFKSGTAKYLCVISTTSCFAPRAPDSIQELAVLCEEYGVPHVINNAYGLQSSQCASEIAKAAKKGRVDFFIQSTDKNFMVPVGGAIIAGFDKESVEKVAHTYPGRASMAPSVDLLITLLSMGSIKYMELQAARSEMFKYLWTQMNQLALKYGERILNSPHNKISIAFSLKTIGNGLSDADRCKRLTELGSMLFTRNVFGARVVTCEDVYRDGYSHLEGWGAHTDRFWDPPYLTAAATIGMEKSDVDIFIKKLDECLTDIKKKEMKKSPQKE